MDEMDTYPFEWEKMTSIFTTRAQVIGGWIVKFENLNESSVAMVFIPDAYHEWKIKKPEAP